MSVILQKWSGPTYPCRALQRLHRLERDMASLHWAVGSTYMAVETLAVIELELKCLVEIQLQQQGIGVMMQVSYRDPWRVEMVAIANSEYTLVAYCSH